MLAESDSTKQLINEAMQDISFKFQMLTEEEMKIISGGEDLQNKWKNTIHAFTEDIDPDDPEYITLRQAFIERFKEHGFVINSVDEFEKQSKELDEILKKLAELQKKNAILQQNAYHLME